MRLMLKSDQNSGRTTSKDRRVLGRDNVRIAALLVRSMNQSGQFSNVFGSLESYINIHTAVTRDRSGLSWLEPHLNATCSAATQQRDWMELTHALLRPDMFFPVLLHPPQSKPQSSGKNTLECKEHRLRWPAVAPSWRGDEFSRGQLSVRGGATPEKGQGRHRSKAGKDRPEPMISMQSEVFEDAGGAGKKFEKATLVILDLQRMQAGKIQPSPAIKYPPSQNKSAPVDSPEAGSVWFGIY
ncbi:hypothetical protein DFH06DRAFT_1139993 [Mycena polygramma]|nr:hypothetical protein DFH06DRAFT_1139993 [Mycena polygramma]